MSIREPAPTAAPAATASAAGRLATPARAPAAPVPSGALTPSAVLALQRSAGNAAVGRALRRQRTLARQPSDPPSTATEVVLGKELSAKLEALMAAAKLSSVSTSGHDMRYSLVRETEMKLPAYLSLTSKYQLSPDQLRLQWGQVTEGHRIDTWSGLRFGSKDWAVEALIRTTYASGGLEAVENQTVGALRLTLAGHFTGEYYNDHRFVWFPMGGGTDQGDTAGLVLSANKLGVPMPGTGWTLDSASTNLRLATGIPNRAKTAEIGGHRFYTDVAHDEVRQGVLSVSASFLNPSRDLAVTVEGGANTEGVRDLFQNQLVHRNLGIPEFPVKPIAQPFFSVTLTKSF